MKSPYFHANVLLGHIQRRCISQSAFAAQAGISAPYLCRILAGTQIPGPRVRRRLLDAVEEHGLGYDDLFDAVN